MQQQHLIIKGSISEAIHRVESIFHDVDQATKTFKDRTSKLKDVKVQFNDQKNTMHAINDLCNKLSNIKSEHETTRH